MNLQQLNQSGRTVGAFLVTAFVSLLVTGFTWFCLEQYNSIAEWKRKMDELMERYLDIFSVHRPKKPRRSKAMPVAVRVAVFFGFLDDYNFSILMISIGTRVVQYENVHILARSSRSICFSKTICLLPF